MTTAETQTIRTVTIPAAHGKSMPHPIPAEEGERVVDVAWLRDWGCWAVTLVKVTPATPAPPIMNATPPEPVVKSGSIARAQELMGEPSPEGKQRGVWAPNVPPNTIRRWATGEEVSTTDLDSELRFWYDFFGLGLYNPA